MALSFRQLLGSMHIPSDEERDAVRVKLDAARAARREVVSAARVRAERLTPSVTLLLADVAKLRDQQAAMKVNEDALAQLRRRAEEKTKP